MNFEMLRHCRNAAAVVLKDWSRYRRALANPDAQYLAICNRHERLELAPDASGYRCAWQWTSDLHAPKYLQGLGLDLMRRALRDHPIRRRIIAPAGGQPQLSFVIGHRGAARLPHLLLTLETIAAQVGAAVECVVVEQDDEPSLAGRLPEWVRHVHTPLPQPDLPYCRSWAFNVGAQHARGDILVLHDNDMLVPCEYAANALRLVRDGYDVLNLKRFIFYLGAEHTRGFFIGQHELDDAAPQTVVQNLEGGGSAVITRAAYESIGGFDEAFIGWGGEDVEFWERASTRRVWPYAFLPMVHLWHVAQPLKESPQNKTLQLYHSLARIPARERIVRLHARHSRLPSGVISVDALV